MSHHEESRLRVVIVAPVGKVIVYCGGTTAAVRKPPIKVAVGIIAVVYKLCAVAAVNRNNVALQVLSVEIYVPVSIANG